jgi:hypothetical protein
VQCDGYTAYKTLVDPAKARNYADRITPAFCWSHLRRRFVDLERRGSARRRRRRCGASPSSMSSSAARAAVPPMSGVPAGKRIPSRWSWH